MKRPGDGISPMELDNLIGRTIRYDLPAETKLKPTDLS
jgi:sialic acid synthase SpsE